MGVARAECPCVVKLRPGFGDDAAADPALACVAGGGMQGRAVADWRARTVSQPRRVWQHRGPALHGTLTNGMCV